MVLAIAFYQETGVDELWIVSGTGKNIQYISAHGISLSLGPLESLALPFFRALMVAMRPLHLLGNGRQLHGKHGTYWTPYPLLSNLWAAFPQQKL